MHGTYTWSHYYGNFDQDSNATSGPAANDAALFIGSSNIGDGAGRQLWNFKYGDLRGDRRNILKLYGSYFLPWNASIGPFFVYQSGQPYQIESVLGYRAFTGSTTDANRYVEPAGRRRSPSQTDLDLNYTQTIGPFRGASVQFAVDVFNVLNRQTGYNYEDRVNGLGIACLAGSTCTKPYGGATIPIPDPITDAVLKAAVGNPTDYSRANYAVVAPAPLSYFQPRRFQITARVTF